MDKIPGCLLLPLALHDAIFTCENIIFTENRKRFFLFLCLLITIIYVINLQLYVYTFLKYSHLPCKNQFLLKLIQFDLNCCFCALRHLVKLPSLLAKTTFDDNKLTLLLHHLTEFLRCVCV